MSLRLLVLWLVAGTLAFAGVLKLVSPLPTARTAVFVVPALSGVPHGALAVPGLVAGLELALAMLLVLGVHPARTLAATAGLLLVFTVVLVILSASRNAPGCGCFGVPRALASRTGEAAAGIARNLGLLGLVGWLRVGTRRATLPATLPRPASEPSPVRRAFTLIEVLVVIAVVVVLLSLALPFLTGTRDAARVGRRVQISRQLNAALTLYCGDHKDGFPFLGTPGSAFTPIRIHGFEVPGPFFRMHRWLWASAVVPDYFEADRSVVEECEGCPGYMQSVLGWPGFIITTEHSLTDTVLASAAFWRDDPGGGTSWLDESYLRQTRLSEIRHPSRKGLLVEGWAGHHGTPRGPRAAVSLGDGSARAVDWRVLDPKLAVERPWGAAGVPIVSTRDGLEGRDW